MDDIFAELVEQHYRPLYRFALSLSRQEATAADLTQQTFYLWATKGHQLRDPSKVKSWLYTTLHREFQRLVRQSVRRPQSELTDEIPDKSAEEKSNSPGDRVDAATALAALGELEEIYRAPLALFYLEEFSYQQIAETLGIPPGTVMSRLSRGKERLRQKLNQ